MQWLAILLGAAVGTKLPLRSLSTQPFYDSMSSAEEMPLSSSKADKSEVLYHEYWAVMCLAERLHE